MKRAILLGLFILLAAGAVGAYYSFSSGLPVHTAVATRGTIREFVDERGKTRLPEEHLITMPFAGRIEAISLIEGQPVSADEIVARISAKDLDEEVAEARAAVDRLQASLVENEDTSIEKSLREQADLFVESMVSTVAAAEARTVAGKSRLDYSEIFLGRTRQIAARGAETQDELDRSELAYVENQVAYRQDVLVAEALKSMQAVTNLLPRVVQEYIAKKSLSGAVIEQEKQEATARLRQALIRQERGVLRSPISGLVLERLHRQERYLDAGTVLLRIGQLDELEVEAEVLSEDVVRIRTGDSVEIYGPALGVAVGSGVAGFVERVYPAGFMKISSLGVEQQRVIIIVRFAEGVVASLRTERELGVDYRVRVRVFTDERPDAILVPRSAVFRGRDGDWEVFVVRGELAQTQSVEVGLMNDDHVQIIQGLVEGDTVILAPETSLVTGARVQPLATRERKSP